MGWRQGHWRKDEQERWRDVQCSGLATYIAEVVLGCRAGFCRAALYWRTVDEEGEVRELRVGKEKRLDDEEA